MGESDRYIEYKHLKKKKFLLGSDNNALMALVTLNIIFFLILLTMQVVYFFYDQSAAAYNQGIVQWFEFPSSLKIFSERPWTILTFMFSDTGNNIMRIFSNMIWLWIFGSILQSMTGNEKLMPIYFYGGVVAAVFFIAAHYLIPSLKVKIGHAALVGANASVLAVATATTYLDHNYRVLTHIRKGMPIWILLTLYYLIDFAGIITMGPAHIFSHLGGALAGFLFVYLLHHGYDAGLWMINSYHWVNNLFSPKNNLSKDEVKNKIFYNTKHRTPFEKSSLQSQQKIDEILDKINLKGYHFLTEEEKEFLKNASKDDNL